MDFEKYYKKIVNLRVTSETQTEMRGHCPFHEDNVSSFSVSKQTGLWNCFGKCSEGGNVYQFHAKMHGADGITVVKAKKDIAIRLGEYLVLPQELIEKHYQLLLKNKSFLNFLIEERGLSLSLIKKFKLGCDNERIYIPIFDEDNYLVNIRRYKPHAKERKMLSYKEGYGSSRLWPLKNISSKEILLVEGELDCLLANQLKYSAITITGGATTFKDEFCDLLKGKIINICYDIDEAGKKGALKAAYKLSQVCKVRLIQLPITEPKNGDFSDYILTHKKTAKNFDTLIKKTQFFEAEVKQESSIDPKIYDVDLNTSAKSEYYYKKIRTKVIVSGKDLAPYYVPIEIDLTCKQGSARCKFCPISLHDGKLSVKFSMENNEILQLIRCSKPQQRNIIRQKVNIPGCNNFEVIDKKVINIEELRVIPEIDYSPKDADYVTRQLYYLGYGIKTNRSYEMVGISIPDPNNQYVTQLISHIKPTQSSIDQFKMTKELYAQLSIFKTKNIHNIIDKINKDLTYNVTKIYGREDLITAVDLIYHSVLQFYFQGQLVQKGWVDGLIIGDTRCGKTESLIQLIQHYKLGELCTGENISYAGLVGGMSQTQQRWSISWGKIPLNDRRLIVLDEVSSLDVDTISNLSALRSSGIAEIIKIQTERTNARTRLIWVSNPRSGRKLDTYNYGVMAIKELIGRVEDIARFDFAISVSANEMAIEDINKIHNEKIDHIYTSELCNQLILWAWSRKPKQVKFTKEAEKLILKYAIQLGKKYSSTLPLVEGAEQRINLAKMSVAIAARTFSTDDGETVIVRPEHVNFICDYLEKIFTKPSLAYDQYSKIQDEAAVFTKDKLNNLVKEFKEFPSCHTLRQLLLEYQGFRKIDLTEQMGYETDEGRQVIRWMTFNKLIKLTPIGYVKQPTFTKFLKEIKLNDNDGKYKYNI